MILKPQDVVVLLKLVALGPQPWTYQHLAVELSISQSEVHAGVRRAVAARLMSDASTVGGRPVLPALAEFLIHGVRYAYPPERGELTRGMPTAYAAPPRAQSRGERDSGAPSGACESVSDPNTELLVRMAEALGDLRERLVFVGGCATALLITDPAAAPARAAQDVDAAG